jgi:hypothetical protein
MKKGFFSIRRALIAASVIITMGAVFSACRKDSDSNNEIPVSGLMAFNLAPDQSALGVALSGNLLTNSPLSYTNYTGGYRNIFPGERVVQSYDYQKDTTLVTATHNFTTQKYYSLFVVGNNGAYKNVIVQDEIDSLPSTQAYVRYINAIPDSSNAPTVTIKANGANVVNAPAAFSTVSAFTPVNGGNIDIAIANGGNVSANRTIAVENGKIYTVLFVGLPAATDTAKAVQIKYILNGTITPDDDKQ